MAVLVVFGESLRSSLSLLHQALCPLRVESLSAVGFSSRPVGRRKEAGVSLPAPSWGIVTGSSCPSAQGHCTCWVAYSPGIHSLILAAAGTALQAWVVTAPTLPPCCCPVFAPRPPVLHTLLFFIVASPPHPRPMIRVDRAASAHTMSGTVQAFRSNCLL